MLAWVGMVLHHSNNHIVVLGGALLCEANVQKRNVCASFMRGVLASTFLCTNMLPCPIAHLANIILGDPLHLGTMPSMDS